MTVVYAPGTEETDPKKQNISLQQNAAANVANATNIAALQTKTTGYESAWTSYTPTVTAGSGTFTTVSATGRYLAIGKTVFVVVDVTITANGTAATTVNATLPAAAASNFYLTGREVAATGDRIQGIVAGSTVTMFNMVTNAYPGGTGTRVQVSGVYEAA